LLSFAVVSKIITGYPHFFTATILGWKKLLKPDKYKDILIESMQFLATHHMRSQSQINCDKFPNGIYFVKARSDEKLFIGKFIKH